MDKLTRIMHEHALRVLNNAYAPYSNFKVAACLCTSDDHFFSGVNVENTSYGLTVCAESSAICQMVSAGYTQIKSILVLAGSDTLCPPCGSCRQKIMEFALPETRVLLANSQKILETHTIADLLPLAFKFKPQFGCNND